MKSERTIVAASLLKATELIGDAILSMGEAVACDGINSLGTTTLTALQSDMTKLQVAVDCLRTVFAETNLYQEY